MSLFRCGALDLDVDLSHGFFSGFRWNHQVTKCEVFSKTWCVDSNGGR